MYLSLNSAQSSRWLIPRVAQAFLKDVTLESFECHYQRFRFPFKLTCERGRGVFTREKRRGGFYLEKFHLADVKGFLGPQKPFKIIIDGLDIEAASFRINDLHLSLEMIFARKALDHLNGHGNITLLEFSPYSFERIVFNVSDYGNRLLLTNLLAYLYEGFITGQISLDYGSQISYIIKTEFDKISLQKLKEVHPQFFSKIQGRCRGIFEMAGHGDNITSLQLLLEIPKDGKLKASVLQPLLDYLPESSQKKDLELLIKSDGEVLIEKTILDLKSISDEKLTATIDLTSEKFNLDIHTTIDLNIEGGLRTLYHHAKRFLF